MFPHGNVFEVEDITPKILRALDVVGLLFVDGVVPMASSGCDLQRALGWFAAKCNEVLRFHY